MTKEDYTAARRAIGTQEAVSAMLGIHRTTIAQRERGVTPISREMELAITHIRFEKTFSENPSVFISAARSANDRMKHYMENKS